MNQFILDRKREEVNFLWKHPELSTEVVDYAKQGLSDNEITWKLWNIEWAEKIGISPEAIGAFLKEKWLGTRIRQAIKFMPLVKKSKDVIDNAMNSDDEAIALKSAMYVHEKMNPDYEDKKIGTQVNNTNIITQINIETVEDEKDPSYLLADVHDED